MMDIGREYQKANVALCALLILFLLTPFLILTIPAAAPLELPCFVKAHIGDACSGCGLTRSIKALYSGKWTLSRHYHPAGAIIVMLAGAQLLLRFLFMARRSTWIPWLDMTQMALAGIVVKVLLI